MKKIYTLICAGLFISLSTTAQYTGGTYTAVSSGNWHQITPSSPTIWAPPTGGGTGPGEPPNTAACNNCLIQLLIPGGGTVTMNGQVSLTGGSTLVVGPGVTLKFQATTAAGFELKPSIVVLTSDNGNNTVVLTDATSKIDATGLDAPPVGTAGGYDGLFTSSMVVPTVPPAPQTFDLTKQLGAAPQQFQNDAIINGTQNTAAVHGTTLSGPVTLNGFGTLPIILTSFTATLDQDVVNLAWTTSLEINADHIGIQRSVDAGSHWATIGSEAARNTTGTSTNYTFADGKPAMGTSEYRLQLVDKDGKTTYSQVRTIRNGAIGTVSVFPNPAHNYINVALGGSATENLLVRLYSQSGQLLQLRNVANAGGTTIALSVSGYPEGNYIIVVNGSNGAKQVSNVLISK
ncbi:MAG TPA: T9SS type A sorting domain-containing protein [Puia sp.]|nr:T9SS type A sorting domain-containing protein [Puia sp.]